MIAVNAHFDGKVLVPDEPLDLPANQKVRIQVVAIEPNAPIERKSKPKRIIGRQAGQMSYFGPGWDDPLPDDFWEHNAQEGAAP